VRKLRAASGGDVVVHGSAQLAQTLIDQDLVDELRLMVFPVVLGEGKRLFGPTGDKKGWRLTRAKPVGEGVLTLVYQPATE
jgi:dihydrofolate reductase